MVFFVCLVPFSPILFKQNLNASRPSEHPPVRGEMSKRLGVVETISRVVFRPVSFYAITVCLCFFR